MSLTITSSVFKHNGSIPLRYTCDGDDTSPPLAWNDVPEGAKSLVLIVDDPDAPDPALVNWESRQRQYQGWHLLYADQCPWHEKGVAAIMETARKKGIRLNVKKVESANEARRMPSGFGTFALLKDGKLLEDHYISKRRFMTIIENQTKP